MRLSNLRIGFDTLFKATASIIRNIYRCQYSEIMNDAVELSKRYGLFVSDATHVAIMKSKGIAHIATNDSDFERIDGIDIYKP